MSPHGASLVQERCCNGAVTVVHFVRGNWCSLSVGGSAVCPHYWCILSKTLVHFVRQLVHFVPHISKSLYLSLGFPSSEFKVFSSKQIDQRSAAADFVFEFSLAEEWQAKRQKANASNHASKLTFQSKVPQQGSGGLESGNGAAPGEPLG